MANQYRQAIVAVSQRLAVVMALCCLYGFVAVAVDDDVVAVADVVIAVAVVVAGGAGWGLIAYDDCCFGDDDVWVSNVQVAVSWRCCHGDCCYYWNGQDDGVASQRRRYLFDRAKTLLLAL